MTEEEFKNLAAGDIVMNRGSGNAYVVVDTRKDQVTLIRTIVAVHPDEWDCIKKGQWVKEDFFDAVRNSSDMSDEDKAYWLSKENE